jgi:hypothetical protein
MYACSLEGDVCELMFGSIACGSCARTAIHSFGPPPDAAGLTVPVDGFADVAAVGAAGALGAAGPHAANSARLETPKTALMKLRRVRMDTPKRPAY